MRPGRFSGVAVNPGVLGAVRGAVSVAGGVSGRENRWRRVFDRTWLAVRPVSVHPGLMPGVPGLRRQTEPPGCFQGFRSRQASGEPQPLHHAAALPAAVAEPLPGFQADRAARLSVLVAGRGTRAHPLRAAPPAQPGTVLGVEAQVRARHREPSPRGPACRLASILRFSHSLISDSSQPTARAPREMGLGKRPSEMCR